VTKALQGNRATIINTRDYSTGETALAITIRGHDLTWSSFLLGRGADPNVRDARGNAPLHITAMLNFPEGAKLLLGNGADVNITNDSGETPLILAVQQLNIAMVRLLRATGADPKIPDTIAGKSAHDYAEENPRASAVLKVIDDSKVEVKTKRKVSGPSL